MEEDPLTLKAAFPHLKKWYGPEQKARYGDLPMFWQDLQTWQATRSVMKEFQDEQQRKDGSQQSKLQQQSPVDDKWSNIVENDPIEKLTLNEKRLILARIKFEEVSDKLNKVVILAKEAEKDPNRSPSPDPIYNREGVRMNTREVRMRNRFTEQKKDLLSEIFRLKNVPGQNGPGGSLMDGALLPSKQIQRKIYIPVKDFPGKNFIGLIIGPRGNTQKQLEQETGCKIAIRGKGSVKAGRQGKPEDEVDDLHVIVTGETEEAVDLASEKVELLLRPLDDQDNVHKQKQLRDLAIYNGTFRDFDTCHHCQEKGHKQWECPKKRAMEATAAPLDMGGRGRGWQGPVVCKHCGERSHPSSDCPLLRVHPSLHGGVPNAGLPQASALPDAQASVDQSEFMDFWQEVSGAPASGANIALYQPQQPAHAPPMYGHGQHSQYNYGQQQYNQPYRHPVPGDAQYPPPPPQVYYPPAPPPAIPGPPQPPPVPSYPQPPPRY